MHMSFRRFIPFVLIGGLLFAVLSCKDDWLTSEYDTQVGWKGAIEAPLVYGKLSLQNLLEKFDSSGYVSSYESGLLYVAYSKDTLLLAPELLEIPDQTFPLFYFQVDTIVPGIWMPPVYTEEQVKGFKMERAGDERLDSVHISSGWMDIYVKSTIKHSGTLTLSADSINVGGRMVPSIMIGGEPFHEVIEISNDLGTFEDTKIIELVEGTVLRLDNSVPDSTSLFITSRFELTNSGADIHPSEVVQITNTFRELQFGGAYGYIGDYDSLIVPLSEIEFELLQGGFTGEIKLANPQLAIRTENSLGVPFHVTLEDLEASFKGGGSTPITINPSANPLVINKPLSVGEMAMDSTFINDTNSNIHVAATTDLTGFQYAVRATANPDGETPNFITDDTQLGINIEALVPLDLRIRDVELGDTFDFSFGGEDEEQPIEPENIKSMEILMETDNFMPLDLGVEVFFYLVDSAGNWQKLDSLFRDDRYIFQSGKVDADGRVEEATNKVTPIGLDSTQISNLLDANRLLLRAYVETGNSDTDTAYVKFYDNYWFEFSMGARVELEYETEPGGNK